MGRRSAARTAAAVVLDIGLGVLTRIEYRARPVYAHVVDSTLHVVPRLTPAVLQHLPQVRVPHADSRRRGGRH
jgi:hypothetical protein